MNELPEMTPAQSIQFMLTLPWRMGDVSDDGATYDESEIETVLDYVRQIENRAEAAEAERDALRLIAQTALDHGGDMELVYAPLYQAALEDIASERQGDE